MTTQAARSLASAAREGRIGPAWKQLWSYGLAPCTQEAAAVRTKWAPTPSRPHTDRAFGPFSASCIGTRCFSGLGHISLFVRAHMGSYKCPIVSASASRDLQGDLLQQPRYHGGCVS
eukprot:5540739-Amphidinium_carterae.1